MVWITILASLVPLLAAREALPWDVQVAAKDLPKTEQSTQPARRVTGEPKTVSLTQAEEIGWGTGPRRWGVFSESYLYLIRSGLSGVMLVENYQQRDPAAYKTLPSMKYLSYTSRLLEMATLDEHYGAKVDDAGRRQLIGWIDTNGPYRGLPEIRAINDPRCSRAPVVQRP